MANRNQFEYVGKIFNLKERQTQKGWMYTFNVPINGQSKDSSEELTIWLDGIIFTKERTALSDRGEAHFTAQLQVNPPYRERPQSVGFVGRFIEPVFGNVYRVSKAKNKKPQPPEGHTIDKDGPVPF